MSVENGQNKDKLNTCSCTVVGAADSFCSDSTDDEGYSLKKTVKVGTRGSRLAIAQTELVVNALKEKFPDVDFRIVTMSTRGDRDTSRALLEFGGKAVFVEEFETAILEGEIDIAVHSAKDMPMEIMDGLVIAGTLPRACPQDVLIYKSGRTFAGDEHFVIGTSSLRRQYQILDMYPGAECRNLRGNVNTRIQKLADGEYDAIILAAAGLERLGILKKTMKAMPSDKDGSLKTDIPSPDGSNMVSTLEHISNEISRDGLTYRYLSTEELLPAACQGIIAIETRASGEAYEMVKSINDTRAYTQLICEREVLHQLNAGCHEPIGVYSEISENGEQIKLSLMKVEENSNQHETEERCILQAGVSYEKHKSEIGCSQKNLTEQIHRKSVEGSTVDWQELVHKLINYNN